MTNNYLPLFYFNVFFACVSFSIIMPSLAPYLTRVGAEDPQYLAWVVCIYSIGEMVGSLLFGWFYNISLKYDRTRGPTYVLCLGISLGIVGSIMYLVAGIVYEPKLVFYGRLLQGIWTGAQQSVEQAYLAFAAPPGQRTELTSKLGTFAVLGFILGPAFGAIFTSVDFRLEAINLTVDAYTAPGFFILAVGFAMLFATFFFFKPSTVSGKMLASASSCSLKSNLGLNSSVASLASLETLDASEAHPQQLLPPSRLGISVLLCLFFVHFYSFAVQETITTPLVLNLFDFRQVEVNVLFVGVGILSLLTSTAVGFISRRVSDRAMLVLSLLLGLVGSLVLIDGKNTHLSLPRFLVGFAIITVAFPFGRNVTISMYSLVLGEVEQGFYMGAMLAVGAIPRALGPFWAIKSLQLTLDGDGESGQNGENGQNGEKYHTYIEFWTSSGLFLAGLLLVFASWKSLLPFDVYHDLDLQFEEEEGLDCENALSPATANATANATATATSPPSSTIKRERRNSWRPSLVSQIQGDSSDNLLSTSLQVKLSAKKKKKHRRSKLEKQSEYEYGAI